MSCLKTIICKFCANIAKETSAPRNEIYECCCRNCGREFYI